MERDNPYDVAERHMVDHNLFGYWLNLSNGSAIEHGGFQLSQIEPDIKHYRLPNGDSQEPSETR
jgi:hypothetical protein